jgi:hypothetical protein
MRTCETPAPLIVTLLTSAGEHNVLRLAGSSCWQEGRDEVSLRGAVRYTRRVSDKSSITVSRESWPAFTETPQMGKIESTDARPPPSLTAPPAPVARQLCKYCIDPQY